MKKTSPIHFLLFVCLASTLSCSLLNRHPRSGYSAKAQPRIQTERIKSAGQNEGERLSVRSRLKTLENGIKTAKELDQYSRALPHLKDEAERIEFLEQSDYETRQKWIIKNNFMERPKVSQETMQELIEAQDIAIGMPFNLVRKAWGEPENIDVSGNPKFRNERWKYSKFVSTPDGFKLEKKSVYFEGGKVAGWEVE